MFGFKVEIYDDGMLDIVTTFNTKEEAIRFAKRYNKWARNEPALKALVVF